MRRADAQPPHLPDGARQMRLPQRDSHRVVLRRPVGEHRERPVLQAGGALQAAVGRGVVRGADRTTGRAPAARRSRPPSRRARPDARRRQLAGQSSKAAQTNRPATPSGGHSAGHTCSNRMAEAGQRAAPRQAPQQGVQILRRVGHRHGSGMVRALRKHWTRRSGNAWTRGYQSNSGCAIAMRKQMRIPAFVLRSSRRPS